MELILGNLKCKKGEKLRGYWEIENSEASIPVTLINGGEGKTLVISSGLHSCEYVGIQAALEIAQELEVEQTAGRIIILHPVNYTGFFKKMPALVPEDGKNLNKVFPGKKDGTLSEKIAYSFTKYLYPQADFFLDLHGGDLQEDVTPFVYFPGSCDSETSAKSTLAAEVLSVPYRVKSSARTGAYSYAALLGIPGLLVERGGRGSWTRELVEDYKKDILSIAEHMKLTNQTREVREKNQKEITEAAYLESENDGFWYPYFNPGDCFKKGELLGELKDCFGDILESFRAKYDGIILYETISLAVAKGDPLIAYGKI